MEWYETWGTGDSLVSSPSGLAADNAGNVYVVGDFRGTLDLTAGHATDNVLSAAGSSDVYLIRFDGAGRAEWVRTWGANGPDLGFGVSAARPDHIYVTGAYSSGTDFDPSPETDVRVRPRTPCFAGLDVGFFVSKFTSDGEFVWARTGRSCALGRHVGVDDVGNIYVSGETNRGCFLAKFPADTTE